MRILIYTIIILMSTSLSAQFKQVQTSAATPPSEEITIEVPDFKKKVVTERVNGTFKPKSIKYSSAPIQLKVDASADGKPVFISGLIERDEARGLSLKDEAMNYLVATKSLMDIKEPATEWELISSNSDDLGMSHLKFQQMYKGIPIYGSEVIVHGDEKGMNAVNGRYLATPELEDITPSLSADQALSTSNHDLGEIVKMENDKFGIFDKMKSKTELVIYNDKEEVKLAYHVTAYKDIVGRWEYMVDAKSGEILQKHESICKLHNHKLGHKCKHTEAAAPVPPVISNSPDLFGNTQMINTFQSGSNFFMIDAARTQMFDAVNSSMPNDPVGTIWTIDAFDTSPQNSNFEYDHVKSSSINFPNQQRGVSAHVNGGKAFDYFINVHQRLSINGQGGNIISLVNVADEDGGGMDNAFWNGVAMFYGNGRTGFNSLARGLDVAGHEMTHGVIQSTANLQYMGESGALNESFADVFGVMIDRDDWLIGEDVVKLSSFPTGALRSMIDPHNGAAQGDFGNGFQPKKYSERFTGSQDNGGVHINSGIPNHAFYLFANNNAVGKAKAEKVYYRALTMYLTKSSQFVDARAATVRAAQDLYGESEVNALRSAWDQVEVFGEDGTDYEVDVETNPGEDLIVFTATDGNEQFSLFVAKANGEVVFDPATDMDPISQPSVTDDGSEILYITKEQELGYLFINWETGAVEQNITFNSPGGWRNAVFSKDGLRMAAIRQVQEDSIFVFDFVSNQGAWYELTNPTFSQDGTSTDDVQFADALEFDFSGEFVMYDAFNRIEGIFGSDIEYWDIGFVKVWNAGAETFALPGQIEKLFAGLPEGVSVGNPTFSKNSPFIIAYDEIKDGQFSIKGANTETNQIGTIFSGNDRPGYPSFSNDDNVLIFDARNNQETEVIAGVNLADNKIEANGQAGVLLSFEVGVRWGVWFANGDRELTSTEETLLAEQLKVYPNPTTGIVTFQISDEIKNDYQITVIDMMGKVLKTTKNVNTVNISDLPNGQYIMNLTSGSTMMNTMVVKQ